MSVAPFSPAVLQWAFALLLRKIQDPAAALIEQAIDRLRLTSQACHLFEQQPVAESSAGWCKCLLNAPLGITSSKPDSVACGLSWKSVTGRGECINSQSPSGELARRERHNDKLNGNSDCNHHHRLLINMLNSEKRRERGAKIARGHPQAQDTLLTRFQARAEPVGCSR